MSYRFMRMLIFFDLPTETPSDRRNYRLFRKMLIRNGFLMMQESVYCKLLLNTSAEKTAAEVIRKNKPPKGHRANADHYRETICKNGMDCRHISQ